MKTLFILPDIQDLMTGGNIYNSQIIEKLGHLCQTETIIINSDYSSGQAAQLFKAVKSEKDRTRIVDTLLLNNNGFVNYLRESAAEFNYLLLVHALNILNPELKQSGKAEKERALLYLFKGFITTSEYSKKMLLREGISEKIIVVIKPGLENLFRAPIPVKSGKQLKILTVSNIIHGKGLIEFLENLPNLKFTDWMWEIAGETSLDPMFFKLFSEKLHRSPVKSQICMHQAVPRAKILALYDSCDIFALPSRFETSGMAIMEAMGRGLPVIAFDVGGISDWIEDGTSGVLVPVDYEKEFIQKLDGLLLNRNERRRLSEKALERSRSFEDWANKAKTLLNFMELMDEKTI